ncbi:MAG: hypothetical protein ACOCW2_00040 [Chitinivibrionales bacterium]
MQKNKIIPFASMSLVVSGIIGALVALMKKKKTPWYKHFYSLRSMQKKSRSFTKPVGKKAGSLFHSIRKLNPAS